MECRGVVNLYGRFAANSEGETLKYNGGKTCPTTIRTTEKRVHLSD